MSALTPSLFDRLRAIHAAATIGGIPIGPFLRRGDATLRDAGLLEVVGGRLQCTTDGRDALDRHVQNTVPDASPDFNP